jgi:DNA modification methylase
VRAPKTEVLIGDNRQTLATLPEKYFHSCVTSPPYFNLRDYGRAKWEGGDPECEHEQAGERFQNHGGWAAEGRSVNAQPVGGKGPCVKCGATRIDTQIGREKTPAEFVAELVKVFSLEDGVGRVLRDDGILFVNLGDTYGSPKSGDLYGGLNGDNKRYEQKRAGIEGMNKQLIGVPWMFAFAMREAGWMLRQEIIWVKALAFTERHAAAQRRKVMKAARRMGLSGATAAKLAAEIETMVGACMPQSVTDRCTTSHEHVFMFTKQPDYYADMESVKESGSDHGWSDRTNWKARDPGRGLAPNKGGEDGDYPEKGRNLRSAWFVVPEPYAGDHFAAYPTRLVHPLIKMATSDRGCCPKCGAPVERVIETEKLKRERPNKLTKRTGEAGTGNHCDNTVDGVATRTKGWRPSCKCPITKDDCVPCRGVRGGGAKAAGGVRVEPARHEAQIQTGPGETPGAFRGDPMSATHTRKRRRQALADSRFHAKRDWMVRYGDELDRLRFEPSEVVALATAAGLHKPTVRKMYAAARAANVQWPNHWRRMRNRETHLNARQWSRLDRLVRIAANWNNYDGRARTVADVANWLEDNYAVRRPLPVIDAALRSAGIVLPYRENWR